MEDMSVKRLSEEVLGMVKMFNALFRKSLQQVPNDVDEETAKNIMYTFSMSQIPEELVSRCYLKLTWCSFYVPILIGNV